MHSRVDLFDIELVLKCVPIMFEALDTLDNSVHAFSIKVFYPGHSREPRHLMSVSLDSKYSYLNLVKPGVNYVTICNPPQIPLCNCRIMVWLQFFSPIHPIMSGCHNF